MICILRALLVSCADRNVQQHCMKSSSAAVSVLLFHVLEIASEELRQTKILTESSNTNTDGQSQSGSGDTSNPALLLSIVQSQDTESNTLMCVVQESLSEVGSGWGCSSGNDLVSTDGTDLSAVELLSDMIWGILTDDEGMYSVHT